MRRLVHCDLKTGARRYSEPFSYPADRLASTDWAYCETVHSSQGRTVAVSTALVTGSETRQWLNTAMTRGVRDNRAIVATEPAKVANARPGTRPAPELHRAAQLEQERAGRPPLPRGAGEGHHGVRPSLSLTDVLAHQSRHGRDRVLRRNLSGADHMAMLHAQWKAGAHHRGTSGWCARRWAPSAPRGPVPQGDLARRTCALRRPQGTTPGSWSARPWPVAAGRRRGHRRSA